MNNYEGFYEMQARTRESFRLQEPYVAGKVVAEPGVYFWLTLLVVGGLVIKLMMIGV